MSPTPEKSHGKWILLTTIAVAVLLPLILVVYRFVSFRSGNAAAIRQLEAKIKQNNEPLTLNDLANMYAPIPDNENGAVALLLVWERDAPDYWRSFREGSALHGTKTEPKLDPALPFLGAGARLFDHKSTLSATNRAAAERYLKEQKERMDALRAALRYPKFRFPILITNGYDAILPHLAQIKHDAQVFRVEALLAIEQGNPDVALKDLDDMARTANTLTEEPVLISQLVRLSCYSMILDEAQRVLSHQPLSTVQLDQLDAVLDQIEITNALRTALIGERAFGLNIFRQPAEAIGRAAMAPGAPRDPAVEVGVGMLSRTGLQDADKRLYLETLDGCITLADREGPESLKGFKKLFENAGTEARRMPPKPFSNMLLPALGKSNIRFAAYQARHRAAKSAVAIERYRLSHNSRLPGALDELVSQFLPTIPNDPFDGKPMRFHSTPTGYVVYSVGENGRDDGGKERGTKVTVKDSDETFFVER
jgi:hypothetical protein